ncbi:MAG: hypothetical protein U0359_27775 [Byssovorax sp.]
MNIRALVTSLALPLAALSMGCVIQAAPPPPTSQSGALEVIEFDSSSPVQMGSGLADGKPPRLKPGAAMAYWVWQSRKGQWHLRSTTSRQVHRFQGRIRPLSGASLTALTPTRNEWNDRMRMNGSDIVFDFVTQGGEDGFDFGLTGNSCVEMDLRIDAAPHPKLIVLGQTEQSPASAHFIACP